MAIIYERALFSALTSAVKCILQNFKEGFTESLPSKHIEEGVQAAVKEGDALSYLESKVNVVRGFAVIYDHGVGVNGFDQQNAVVGQLGEEESYDNHDDDL